MQVGDQAAGAAAAAASTAGAAAAGAAAAAADAFWMACVIPGTTTPLSRSIAWPKPSWLAALLRSLMIPPELVGVVGTASEGSPRIG